MKKLCLIFSFIFLSTLNTSSTIGYCDIKGYVKNPGVYEIKENYTIQDIINVAGGLKNKAYTNNINLSKKVKDEMVIYIFSNSEINKINELNSCECTPTYKYIECEEITSAQTTAQIITEPITITTTHIITTKNSNTTTSQIITTLPITTTHVETTTHITTSNIHTKININTCTLEDLIKLNGLGEVKAENIILYRETNGLFNKIEDILKVDGIGNKTFENIKNFIEI